MFIQEPFNGRKLPIRTFAVLSINKTQDETFFPPLETFNITFNLGYCVYW